MTDPRYGAPPSPPGERWNVNYPAIIGVIFVFLLGVIVWVIATGGDDEGDADDGAVTSTVPSPTAAPTSAPAAPGTTTPAPMPSSVPSATTDSTSPPTTPPPSTPTEVTSAPGAGPGAVAGDLGIGGRPMQQPGCDGAYITILASAVGEQATAAGIANVLEAYPGSNYLRTDQTCPSLNPAVEGQPIYVVYFGPFAYDTDACAARAEGPDGAYARILSRELGPDHGVPCG